MVAARFLALSRCGHHEMSYDLGGSLRRNISKRFEDAVHLKTPAPDCLPFQALVPLLSSVSHLLTMRSNRKPDVIALESYGPKRIHQSSVCRIQHAMTRL
jgi:hypothetical protein